MGALCHNRTWDNNSFGPTYRGHLTTCFIDVVFTPLATWVLLLLTPLVIFACYRGTGFKASAPKRKGVVIATYVYDVLCIAMVGMYALEMARLQKAHFGIGLLPFVPVACVVAIGMLHAAPRSPRLIPIVLTVWWVLLGASIIGKLHCLAKIKQEGFTRQGTAYPTADELSDNAVDLGVVAILCMMSLAIPFAVDSRGDASEVHRLTTLEDMSVRPDEEAEPKVP